MRQSIFSEAVDDLVLVVKGAADLVFQVANNDAAIRYMQIYDVESVDDVDHGTTPTRSVMFLPASGGNTWDKTFNTRVEKGCVIAVCTSRVGNTLATSPADVEARF